MTVLIKWQAEVALISHRAGEHVTRMVAIIFQAAMPLKALGVEIWSGHILSAASDA